MDISYYGMIIITTCIVSLSIYELVAVFFYKNKQSFISTIMQKAGFKSPFIAFGFGTLVGHFWMYYPPTLEGEIIKCNNCHEEMLIKIDEKTNNYYAEKEE
jgi:hypothetical protein